MISCCKPRTHCLSHSLSLTDSLAYWSFDNHASDASKLYLDAEIAIKASEATFKSLSREWDSSKRVLEKNFKESMKADDLIKNIEKVNGNVFSLMMHFCRV